MSKQGKNINKSWPNWQLYNPSTFKLNDKTIYFRIQTEAQNHLFPLLIDQMNHNDWIDQLN